MSAGRDVPRGARGVLRTGADLREEGSAPGRLAMRDQQAEGDLPGTMMDIMTREAYEAAERERLTARAAFSDATKGRERSLEPDLYRTEYQRDRDRVIHCKAFRRLSHKTQVFLSPEGDHYRTRLTHTLEVSQISRSIARALALNEDLTEAIALGHDLGHTPFGHTGEDALNEALPTVRERWREAPEQFKHNEQSLRIVEHLEYEGKGLNLTAEVRDGILGHTGGHVPATLEGQIVRVADRIAYVNHDIDDALRGGVIAESELPTRPITVLGTNHGARIRTMVRDMIATTAASDEVSMSPEVWDAMMELRQFLFDRVYFSPKAKAEEPRANHVVQALFFHYLEHPAELPVDLRPPREDDLPQAVIDYVAGMTDRFAIRDFERLFVPKKWLV